MPQDSCNRHHLAFWTTCLPQTLQRKTGFWEIDSQQPGFSVPFLHISIKTSKKINTTHINKTPHRSGDPKKSFILSKVEGKPGNKRLILATTVVQEVFVHPSQMFKKKEKVQGFVTWGMGMNSSHYMPGQSKPWVFLLLTKMIKTGHSS